MAAILTVVRQNFQVVLICISLVAKEIFLKCFLAICSSFEHVLFSYIPEFNSCCLLSQCLVTEVLLCILDTNSLLDMAG